MTTPRGMFVAFFFLLSSAFSVVAGEPSIRVAIYAFLTWSLFVFAAGFWSIDYVAAKRTLGWAGVCVLAFLIVLLMKHGAPKLATSTREIGGIQPNDYAQAAVVSIALAFFLPRWATYPAVAIALTLILRASSRGLLLSATVFLVSYAALTAQGSRASAERLRIATVVLAFTGVVLMLDLYLLYTSGTSLLTLLSDKVLLLDDPIRGLGTGFTGRTELWLAGLNAISQTPLVGHGFRRQIVIAHDGYLNLMSDIGIPLGVSFIVFVIFQIRRRIRTIRRLTAQGRAPADGGVTLLHRVVGAYLISVLTEWVFEPNYLNLGIPYTVLLVVFLAAPYELSRFGKASYTTRSHARDQRIAG